MSYSRATIVKGEEAFIDGLGTHRSSMYIDSRPHESLEARIRLLTNYIVGLDSNSNWTSKEKAHLQGIAEAKRQQLRRIVSKFKLEERVPKRM